MTELERDRERKSRERAAGREVVLTPIRNKRRRNSCARDLLRFARLYFSRRHPSDPPGSKPLLSAKLSPRHIETLTDFQRAILHGGLYAKAAPRGFGKDTLATIALLWGCFYGHITVAVIACYKAEFSDDTMARIKFQCEFNGWLGEDFPEVVCCVRGLEHSPQRAAKQTIAGAHTNIRWGDRLRFPDVKGFPGSGRWIIPASIRASVRGILTADGTRPDFTFVSDPQTDDSAHSQGPDSQTEKIMRTITNDIGGLAGHLEPMKCFALVTVICPGDVAHQLTDIEANPQWHGVRFGAFESWPERSDLWEQYRLLMSTGARENPPDTRTAMRFYLDNRVEMDSGAVVCWEDGYVRAASEDGTPLEISAVQHYQNILWRTGEEGFWAEYQNDPKERVYQEGNLNKDAIKKRISSYARNIADPMETKIVRGIDIGGRLIHYATVASDGKLNASVIDYSRVDTLAQEIEDTRMGSRDQEATEICVLNALRRLRDEEMAGRYEDANGKRHVDLTLIDTRYMEDAVRRFVAESGPKFRMTKGLGTATAQKFTAPRTKNVLSKSAHWYSYLHRQMHVWALDADHWKQFVHARLAQDTTTEGALVLYEAAPEVHEYFARHILAEHWDVEAAKMVVSSNNNHWLDCSAIAFAGLDMLGLRLTALAAPVRVREARQSAPSPIIKRQTTGGIRSRY